MNVMITSPGRRVELVEYFKEALNRRGDKLFTLDMSEKAPALYFADKHFVVEKDFDRLERYIDEIVHLCKKNDIGWVITLIDPELTLFRKYEKRFEDAGIRLFMPDKAFNDITFDKFLFYETFGNLLPFQRTFSSRDEVLKHLSELSFPLIAKDRYGSGSIGIFTFENEDELSLFKDDGTFIFQEKLRDFEEFSVHLYFDAQTGRIVDLFMSKTLSMRAGEADKALSVWDEEIFEVLKKLERLQGIRGTINVDVFKTDGRIYVNEINPRFGGGYNHAHHCGCNFVSYSVKNMYGEANEPVEPLPRYQTGIMMMKYNGFYFKRFDR